MKKFLDCYLFCLTKVCYFLFTFAFLSASSLGASQVYSTASRCTDLLLLNITDVKITSAELIPANKENGFPEVCDVFGFLRRTVGFEIVLTTDWNGKMYFAGNFGFGGEFSSSAIAFTRGYATITTDTGHKGTPPDATWALNNRPAEIDYGYRAVHQVAVLGKMIIKAYYGRGPTFSYFNGCSSGGRQGLMEAQKYPADFNGIVAGAPSMDWTGIMITNNWDMQALQATESSSLIPFEKFEVIANAVLEECDAIDGLADGLVDDPRNCHFKPKTLLCKSGDGPDCLTQPQVEALNKISSGPRDSSGRHLYPGFPVGGILPNLNYVIWLTSIPDFPFLQYIFQDQFFRYMAFKHDNPNFDWRTFNFDTDPARMHYMAGILNATNTDLSRYHELGGKLLLWQGWSDAAIAPTRVIQYYQEVRKRLGTQDAGEAVRLFMVPGMLHCCCGPGPNDFDYLTAIEQWVEQGVAPESMEATHYAENGTPDRTRPLCRYPMVARYDGSGNINRAANFTCVNP